MFVLLPEMDGFFRSISGAIPADLFVTSMAAKSLPTYFCSKMITLGELISDIATATSCTHQCNGVVRRCAKVPRDVQNAARAAELSAPIER